MEQWISGAVIALQLYSAGDENVVQRLREEAGPHDPEIGKHIRPNTLRAKYGHNRVENALHTTDLHEDGILEVCDIPFTVAIAFNVSIPTPIQCLLLPSPSPSHHRRCPH